LTLVDVGLRDFGLRVVVVLTKQTYAAHQALQKMTTWKMTNEKWKISPFPFSGLKTKL